MPTAKQLTLLRDTRRGYWLAWRFVLLNLFQLAALLFFASGSALAFLRVPGVGSAWTVGPTFLAAAAAYAALLINPSIRSIRVLSVAVPLVAAGVKINDLLRLTPVRPGGLVVWLFVAFVFLWVAPRLMPPPLSNGERRRWLANDPGGRRFG